MEAQEFSMLSSLRGEPKLEEFIQPHYKESYRLAIDCLASGGRESYQKFLKEERLGSFLSEDELLFITRKAENVPPKNDAEETTVPVDSHSSSGTYWPVHSEGDAPDLELGWPDVLQERLQTNIDLLFHPPRQNNPTIKEVVRKHIQDARQVIAIAMDEFTDVDIFKEAVDASIRGVPVYVLLDDFHLKSFLAMAENQDVKINQLRNMRVRTVKGPDYLCRSGVKFHGAMEQKFLLVDCLTAIYGSYGFTWSFEKIHLSMVQLITGHLVKSYDEEFRTLYARSTVPSELCPPEGLTQRNGRQILPQDTHKVERRDQLRHTLDTVYRKTCEMKLGARDLDLERRLFEEEPYHSGLLKENGIAVNNQMPQFLSTESNDFIKRHSYAGERQDECIPPNFRPRASNWNISRETGSGINHFPVDNYLHVPQIQRGHNMRQSYSGNDKRVISMQQNMPTLENTSKSFMRTFRIESYLKRPEVPFGDSCDYLDQVDPQDKGNSFMQGRMRSSLVFRPTVPEQMEPNRHINSSTCVNSLAAPNTPSHYSSMHWNPTAAADTMSNDGYMFNRKSLQVLDDSQNKANSGPGRGSYPAVYASLGRSAGRHLLQNPDTMSDNWQKRRSLADPRPALEYKHESSSHVYGDFSGAQVNRSTAEINAQSGGYRSNLKEDQRSSSHYDVKRVTDCHVTPNWQQPPSRTASAAALEVKSKGLTPKSNSMSQPHFPMKTSKKILPEKKEDSVGTSDTLSLQSSCSTDTLTADDEPRTSYRGAKHPQSTTHSVRSSSGHQMKRIDGDHLTSSKPRFRAEELKNPPQVSLPKPTTQKKPGIFERSARPGSESTSWSKDRGPETRLYSRYESFCSIDKKRSQEKTKTLPKGDADIEHNITRAARGHHENKLEKFLQRMGHLIHKNKQ
ncbi:protein FAM83B [Pungitius pungitius]|uniref:protein FAM83B n=1 Tax=Pungitius pungitius TaxID=134920 RepID=UPI002E12475A